MAERPPVRHDDPDQASGRAQAEAAPKGGDGIAEVLEYVVHRDHVEVGRRVKLVVELSVDRRSTRTPGELSASLVGLDPLDAPSESSRDRQEAPVAAADIKEGSLGRAGGTSNEAKAARNRTWGTASATRASGRGMTSGGSWQ